VSARSLAPSTRLTLIEPNYRECIASYFTSTLRANISVPSLATSWLRVTTTRSLPSADTGAPFPPPNTSHLDLVRSIWTLRDASPLSLSFRHVRGHQDDWVAVSCLDPLAQLNVGADALAKEHLRSLISHGHTTVHRPLAGEVWSCWLSSHKVIHDPHHIIPHHLGIRLAKEYLIQKQLFSPASFDLVDWTARQSATASLPDQLAMWAAKFLSGHCAVGRTMLRRKQWDHSNCPCCALPDETSRHVLLCSNPGARQVYSLGIASLRQWLEHMQTDPHITGCLCDTLLDASHRDFTFFASPGYTLAASDQTSIGTFCTSLGCVARSWLPIQAQYFQSIGSRRSTSRWCAQLARKLMEFSHSLWVHRNSVLHAQNEQGRTAALSALRSQVDFQFSLGTADLLAADQVYVTRFSPASLSALAIPDQERWLSAIRLAREHGRTLISSELSSMRRNMATFLGRDI